MGDGLSQQRHQGQAEADPYDVQILATAVRSNELTEPQRELLLEILAADQQMIALLQGAIHDAVKDLRAVALFLLLLPVLLLTITIANGLARRHKK